MKPERWQQLDQIFHSALGRAPGARARFLDEACVGDKSLRKEVEALLSAHDRAGSFMESPALELEVRSLARDQNELVEGQRIGHYKILYPIGAGAMGEVYLVHDMQLGRKVALKLLPAEFTQETNRMRRFQQEARAASALNHPNIITIHGIGQAEGRHFIVTEFIDGETLRQHIRKSESRITSDGNRIAETEEELREALHIAMQVADALAAAHAKGIVHRDIKPENIMLVRHDQSLRGESLVKVLDFGIAKLTEQQITRTKGEATTKLLLSTHEGSVIGTASYMSPEQARGENVDARTDIWSLGIVLYEMLAHKQPFEGTTRQDVIASILKDQVPPLPVGTPDRLIRIVEKALRKNREERYQTINDMFLDLAGLATILQRSALPKQKREVDSREPEPNESGMEGPVSQTVNVRPLPISIGLKRQSVVIAVSALLVIASVGLVYRYIIQRRSASIGSIAVLPFINASGDSEVEYLSAGISETLINSLSQLENLSVKSHSSVLRYKGKDVEPQQIAYELGVQVILNGRVIQRGDDLTLYLWLDDGRTGNRLWGEEYKRRLTDLATLQSQITSDVLRELRIRLSNADEQRMAKNYPDNAEAYSLYLRGRHHLFRMKPTEIQEGISSFQQAIDLDPSYAPAYVGLAMAYRTKSLSLDVPAKEVFPLVQAAAQKAVEIDDTLAEAHAVLGFSIFFYDWNWNEAENQFKRALELDPTSADAHWGYGHLLSRLGRHTEAIEHIQRARELAPLSLMINAMEGLILLDAGYTDEALAVTKKTLKLEPGFWVTHIVASNAYIQKGMFTEALVEARTAAELNKDSPFPIANVGYILARSGKRADALFELEILLKLSTEHYVSPYSIALIYNGLGEREKTLAWLNRSYMDREPRMTFLKVEARWNNLRDDPRFQDLVRSVGL